jgi:hypothetical protein
MTPISRRTIFFALSLIILIAFIALLLSSNLTSFNTAGIAQGANLKWENTYGESGDDRAFFAVAATDGYLVLGSSTSNEKASTDAWVVRLANNGNTLWSRKYRQNMGAEFRAAINLEDGFLLVGNTFLVSGETKGYVVKIDAEGNLLWNILLDAGKGVNKIFSAAKSPDGFVLVGLTDFTGGKNSDVWLIGLNANGNVTWNKTFGGAGENAGRSVTVIQGNIMVAGYSDDSENGNFDFLVVKTDLAGKLLWNKTYGGLESDKAYSIIPAPYGAVIAGDTRSKGSGDCDAWVIKIDLNGNLIWDKTIGGSGFDTVCYGTSSRDGGYILCGTTFSFGNGNRDFWMFEMNDLGKVSWSCTVGRTGYEEAYVVIQESNNEVFAAGWTNSIGEGRYDFYVVQLDVRRGL